MEGLQAAIGLVFEAKILLTILLASIFGLFVGAIPGLTATMATALLVPVTFFMGPVQSIAAIVSATVMTIFAGDIPGALLRIPGTPASAAYTDDAYRMGQRGQAGVALGISLLASIISGVFAVLVMAQFAPQLARVSLGFTSFEYFWLALLGLSSAVLVSSGSALKGCIAMGLGLMLSMVGMDPVMGTPRLAFDTMDLMAGISILPTMIGVFAIAELLRKAPVLKKEAQAAEAAPLTPGPVFRGAGRLLWRYRKAAAGGSVIGTVIGILPGAGADIAAWVAYAVSKRFSKEPQKYGTGHPEGIVCAGASNNAALTGSYVPALVFGIPGDTVTAIVIGVLLMKGITPGPMVFTQQAELVYSLYLIFIIASILMVPLGWCAIKLAGRLLRVPQGVLYPVILMFCIVGSYAANNSLFDIWVMLGIGVLAFAMERTGFPTAPLILAMILGPVLEEHFMKSLIKADGDLLMFFDRPLAATLGAITVVVWLLLMFGSALVRLGWRKRHHRLAASQAAAGIPDHSTKDSMT